MTVQLGDMVFPDGTPLRRRPPRIIRPASPYLIDPRLVGVDEDGSAVWAIEGGANGAPGSYVDVQFQPNIADLGSITLATTQKMLWTVGSTSPSLLPGNYWYEGKSVRMTANIKWTAVANTNAITVGMALGAADAAAVNVQSAAVTPVSGTSTFSVWAQGIATCRLRGGAATLSMAGFMIMPSGLCTTGYITYPSAGVTVVSTFDSTLTTSGLYFQAARATAAGDTAVVTNLIMEALN